VDSIEERVATLEGRTLEQSMRIDDVREALSSLEARMDRRFEQLERRLDQRFAGVDIRFAGIDGRLDRMSSQLSNLIVGVAVAAVSGLLGMIAAILR
jgi:uncharacterized coiled-coil protein SlyX